MLHRLSYSDLNIKPDQSNSYNFAKTLFGEDNRLNISSSKSAPNPLAIALFCTKNNRKMLFGKKIANFSNLVFCDSLKYIQTYVGICLASNSVLLLNDKKLAVQHSESTLKEDLRNAEHLIILSVDKFENPSGFKVWLINNFNFLLFPGISLIIFRH